MTHKQTSLEQVLVSTVQTTTAVTRIYYFRIELFEGTLNKNENGLVSPTKDKASERDVKEILFAVS